MVRYAIPSFILAMSVGAMGSDTAALRKKGSVVSSDGASAAGEKVATDSWKDAMKNLKEGLGQNGNANGNANGNGNGNGNGKRKVRIDGRPLDFPDEVEFEPIETGPGDNGRTGSINNGCAGSEFMRGSEGFAYEPAEDGAMSESVEKDPTPRAISVAFHQADSIPNPQRASDWLWQWGQFVDHDYALGLEIGEELRVEIALGDPFYPADVFDHFETERTEKVLDEFGVAQQINDITSHINAGNVYGDTNQRIDFLRADDWAEVDGDTLAGTGRMKTSESLDGFPLLPLAGDDEAIQGLSAYPDTIPNIEFPVSEAFVAGDARVNEHFNLMTVHTLMVREHNYWADMIRAENPDLDGSKVFEYARIIVQSEVQRITYSEFLPLLLGPEGIPPYTGFDPNVDGAALNVGAACAYRIGHTLISPTTLFVDDAGTETHIAFEEGFFTPAFHKEFGLNGFMRGLSSQVCQKVDAKMQSTLTDNLFNVRQEEGDPPRDLYALNVARAREHGIPNYNAIRAAFLGEDSVLPQNTDVFLDTSIFQEDAGETLKTLYPGGPDDADCFPALLSEATVPGAMVGETELAVLSKQFTDLRDSDPFWYENRLEGQLLEMIRDTKLSDIIKRNADVPGSLDDLSENAFVVPE